MGKKVSIIVECDECDGTGLRRGKDTALICYKCGGRGALKLTFTIYTGRRKTRGIKEIRGGNMSMPMTYKEFEKNIPPAPVVPLNFSM